MHLRSSAVQILCLLCLASSAFAQLAPKVGAIYPEGGQRGTTATTTFYGENVAPLTGVVFSGDPGLSFEIPDPITPAVALFFSRGGIEPTKPPSNAAAVRVIIAPDAAPGPREIRAVTAEGVSNPVKFFVGDLPEIMENEATDSPANAQAVTFPVTITGRVVPENDHDFYAFDAEAGKHYVFDVFASRNARSLDAVIFIRNATGETVAQSEDANGFDPLIDFVAKESGRYTLEVRDTRFKGGYDYTYRLSMGEIPYLDSIFPLAGQIGTETTLTLTGINLGANTSIPLNIRADAPRGAQEIRATATTLSNARRFEVTNFPVSAETEPNNARDQAAEVAIPSLINGRIGEVGDVDSFRLKLDAERYLVIEPGAIGFDSDLDALLTVTNAEGATIAQSDDSTGYDSRIAQSFKPGEYTISLRDLLNRGGSKFAYSLRIYEPEPDFAAYFFPDAPVLHRGGTTVLRIEVRRDGGYGGPVEFAFEKLPPGVTADPTLISPVDGSDFSLISLTAASDAPLGPHPIKLAAWGVIAGQRARRSAQPLQIERPFGDPNAGAKSVREGFFYVAEAAPFHLDPISLSSGTIQGQGTNAEARVVRREGFRGDVSVTVEGFTSRRDSIARVAGIGAANVTADQDRAVVAINAAANAETGSRLITFIGTAAIDGRIYTQMTRPIPLSIREIPFMLSNTLTNLAVTALPESSASAAREAVFTIKAERHGWFTEEIPLSIEGVPEGVTVEIAPIARETDEIAVRLVATEKAKTGETVNLAIIGKTNVGGRDYTHRTGNIALTINAPEAETASEPVAAPAAAEPPPAGAE